MEERFVSKTTRQPDGCLVWTACLTNKGYGLYWNGDKLVLAHRHAWATTNGAIDPGLQIDHLCRNRACQEVTHMELVSNRTNVLRGTGITATNATKTHCPQNHPLYGDNLVIYTSGGRRCRQCARERNRRQYAESRRAI